jgi:hypothetical protein
MSGDYEKARANFEAASRLAKDDDFKCQLIAGLHNLTVQIENDMARILRRLNRIEANKLL